MQDLDLQLNEESHFILQRIQQVIDKQQYQLGIFMINKILGQKLPYPRIYILASECYLRLGFIEKAQEQYQKAQQLYDAQPEDLKNQQQYLQIKQLEINIMQEKSDFQNSEIKLNELYHLIEQNEDIQDKKQILDQIKQYIIDNDKLKNNYYEKTIDDRKQEGQDILNLINQCEQIKYFDDVNFSAYVIPMSWFEKWKKYTFITNSQNQEQESPQKKKEDIMESEENQNDQKMQLEQQQPQPEIPQNPGPIDISELLDFPENQIFDLDPKYEYTNYNMKQNLRENLDFTIVGHPVAKKLYEIYNGFQLVRKIICVDEIQQKNVVELRLQPLNIIQLPQVTINQNYMDVKPYTFFMSKHDTIKELREKNMRIIQQVQYNVDKTLFANNFPSRFWKLDSHVKYQEVIQVFLNRGDQQAVIQGQTLNNNQKLEEAELGETDILIFEPRIFQLFVFIQYDKQQDIKIQSQQQNLPVQQKPSQDTQIQIVKSCSYCKSTNQNLQECACKRAFYCNQKCQSDHQKAHKRNCKDYQEENEIKKELIKQMGGIKDLKFCLPSGRKGLVGLQNLGNTCFMNSGLQCLSNVYELTQYMLKNDFINDLNTTNPLGTKGNLALAYAKLIREMWQGKETFVSAWELKKVIGKFASQFYGYQQQDSLEFLNYLLDGIHEDMNLVREKPIVEQIESDGNQEESLVANQAWENYLKRNQSIIQELMVGQFKSTLVCPECHRISITFDPFMHISVPLPPPVQTVKVEFYMIKRTSFQFPSKVILYFQSTATYLDLLRTLEEKTQIPTKYLEGFYLKDQRIYQIAESKQTVKYIRDFETYLYMYEMFNPNVDYENYIEDASLKIKVELLLWSKRNYVDKPFTFCRIFYVDKNISHKNLHLKVYQAIRYNLSLQLEKTTNPQKQINQANQDKISQEELEQEYKTIIFGEFGYFTIKIQNGKQTELIEFVENKTLANYSKQIAVNVWLNEKLKIEELKFNRCEVASFNMQENEITMPNKKQLTLYDCLELFSMKEILSEGNEWYCSPCKKQQKASKQMQLYKLPKILILQLKRFGINSKVHNFGHIYFSSGGQKISTFVDYPVNELDMTPFCVNKKNKEQLIYDLIGVSNHFGSLGGGHYTATAKNHITGTWFDFNDSNVHPTSEDRAVSDGAYILVYKRRKNQKQQ